MRNTLTTLARPRPLRPEDPDTLGPWRLLARLGAGGMGTVYLARSLTGRTVALKAIHPVLAREAEFRVRFRAEVRATRDLVETADGPALPVRRHFAAVIDADTDGPRPWLATEYLLAPGLQEAVDRLGPWPLPSVRALGARLAEALDVVHRAQLVHRDLKPSNVLVTADGPRIIDFGIALRSGAQRLTQTGQPLGSPAYMAPEQAEQRAETQYSDVFALAGVLVFAATGRGPFGTGTAEELVYRVTHTEPELGRLDALDPDGSLCPVLARCLAKNPTHRPDAAELHGLLAPPDTPPGQPGPPAAAPSFAVLLPEPLLADLAARTTLDWELPVREHDRTGARPGEVADQHASESAEEGTRPPTQGERPSRRRLLLGAAGTLALAAAAGTGAYAAGSAVRGSGDTTDDETQTASSSPAGGQARNTAPRPVWEYSGSLLETGHPVAARGVVLMRSDVTGELLGIDAEKGTQRWAANGVDGNVPYVLPNGSLAVLKALLGSAEGESDRLSFVEVRNGRTWYSPPLDLSFSVSRESPVLATGGGVLYGIANKLGSADDGVQQRRLFAYDIDRARLRWRRSLGRVKLDEDGAVHYVDGPLVLAQERLITLDPKRFAAFDPADGRQLWERAVLDVYPEADPADRPEDEDGLGLTMRLAGRHGVLVCGQDVRLLDPSNGRVKWKLTGKDVPKHRNQSRKPAPAHFTTPAVHRDTMYVAAFNASVLAVNLTNGQRRWIWHADEILSPNEPVTFAGGLVFPPMPDGPTSLTALDPRTGKRLWRTREPGFSSTESLLTTDDERLYVLRGPRIRALPLNG